MIYNATVKNAMKIACAAHKGQFDKGGYPYIAHPLHLAEQMSSTEEACVALLHDVLEDSAEWTGKKLLEAGIPEHIVKSVELLTHNPSEPYFQYINRLAEDSVARKVKMADLRHNMTTARYGIPLTLYARYEKALEILEGYEQEEQRR